MITYTQSLEGIKEEQLHGFFVGWPNPPSAGAFLKVLEGSYRVWLALEDEKVVGFINAVSDGVMAAYIPLLEVLPAYQGRGIGKALVESMLDSLEDFYMVDLLCDSGLQPYYEKFGMQKAQGMLVRHYNRQSCK